MPEFVADTCVQEVSFIIIIKLKMALFNCVADLERKQMGVDTK